MDYFTFTVAELCSNEKYRDQSKLLEANPVALEKVNEDEKEERQDSRGREGWLQGFSSVHT